MVDFAYPADPQFDSPLNLFTVNSSTSPQLAGVEQDVRVSLVVDNNQAVATYSESTYELASALEYVCLATGALSLFLLFLGAFGGRLIALEAVSVVQLSYLSLLRLEDMSCTCAALEELYLSCGYNRIAEYDWEG